MVLIRFIRHAESCSNINYTELPQDFSLDYLDSNPNELIKSQISQPPLSYYGIQQAILLGVNVFNNLDLSMYDCYYYCSPSLRTIMTAMLSLRTINFSLNFRELSPISIVIMPELIEKSAGDFDQQNNIVPEDKLKLMIEYIKWWFINKFFINFDDYELIFYLNQIEELLKTIINKVPHHYIIHEFINNTTLKYILNFKKKCNINKKKELLQQIITNIENDLKSKLISNYEQEKRNIIELNNKLKKFLSPSFYNFNYNFIFKSSVSNIPNFIILNNKIEKKKLKQISKDNKEIANKNINREELRLSSIPLKPEKQNQVLCFSHGLILKETFPDLFTDENDFLKNTEMIVINNSAPPQRDLKHIQVLDYNETKCQNICGELYDKEKHNLFAVINHIMNTLDTKLIIKDLFFNPTIDFNLSLKNKYLKYKKKYLTMKQTKNLL